MPGGASSDVVRPVSDIKENMSSSLSNISHQPVEIRVPGRICLFGDKTDLAGLPVIAATVSCLLNITVKPTPESNRIHLFSHNFPELGAVEYNLGERGNHTHPLKYWCAVVYVMREKIPCGFEATIDSQVPIGKGLASSGAVSVALVRALDQVFSLKLSKQEIAEIAYIGEHDELGIPCGRMDQYAISFGGVNVIFTGESPRVEPISSVKHLPVVVGDTLEPRPLHKLLVEFKRRLAEKDEVVLSAFTNITEFLYKGRDALASGDLVTVGKLMCKQMEQENRLGVATAKLNALCNASVEAGACGAKLMGAGGGGCMVALCPNKETQNAVAAAIEKAGGKSYVLDLVTYE